MERELARATPAIGNRRLAQYFLATLGPISTAGSQFLLLLLLLHAVDQAAFGMFSFLLLGSQLSLGVSSALLCAPYPVLLHDRDRIARQTDTTMFSVNLLLAAATAIFLAGAGLALGIEPRGALIFGLFSGANALRWFARAHAYSQNRAIRVVISDVSYGVLVIAAVGLMYATGAASMMTASLTLLAGALVGVGAFGTHFLVPQFRNLSLRSLPAYLPIWRKYSTWSLLGVLTTEGTANAHAYIVTFVSGPAAFAAIAATSLLIRPITLAMNALTDFERPAMARMLSTGQNRGVIVGQLGLFRNILLLVWIASVAASMALLIWAPRLLFPEEYSLEVIHTGATLWLLIAVVRVMRMAESVFLQAAGEFKTLAFASVASCGVSIIAVAVIVLGGNVTLSLLGIALGELLFAAGIWKRARARLAKMDATL